MDSLDWGSTINSYAYRWQFERGNLVARQSSEVPEQQLGRGP